CCCCWSTTAAKCYFLVLLSPCTLRCFVYGLLDRVKTTRKSRSHRVEWSATTDTMHRLYIVTVRCCHVSLCHWQLTVAVCTAAAAAQLEGKHLATTVTMLAFQPFSQQAAPGDC